MAETQKERIIRILKVSPQEADEILAYDKAVDQGKKTPYDITPEQEKAVRKYRQADRKPFVPDLKPRERKPNEPKREIIQILEKTLAGFASNITVTNVERQIDFEFNGTRYRVVLSAPRK